MLLLDLVSEGTTKSVNSDVSLRLSNSASSSSLAKDPTMYQCIASKFPWKDPSSPWPVALPLRMSHVPWMKHLSSSAVFVRSCSCNERNEGIYYDIISSSESKQGTVSTDRRFHPPPSSYPCECYCGSVCIQSWSVFDSSFLLVQGFSTPNTPASF